VWVILDDDEVSSDEDEPLQMRLRSSSTVSGSSGPASTTVDVMVAARATTDKEATDKRATKEATVKEAADKEVIDKESHRGGDGQGGHNEGEGGEGGYRHESHGRGRDKGGGGGSSQGLIALRSGTFLIGGCQ
jgi:hypothetical protein